MKSALGQTFEAKRLPVVLPAAAETSVSMPSERFCRITKGHFSTSKIPSAQIIAHSQTTKNIAAFSREL